MSVKEKIGPFLPKAQAPASMWCDALPTAVMLQSLRPVKGKTVNPYEVMSGRKQSVYILGYDVVFQIENFLPFVHAQLQVRLQGMGQKLDG